MYSLLPWFVNARAIQNYMKSVTRAALGLTLIMPAVLQAASPSPQLDASHEEFLLGTYPGSQLESQHYSQSEMAPFLTKLNTRMDPEIWGQRNIMGESSVVVYSLPKAQGMSTSQVYDSIAHHLEQAGFETQLSCSGQLGGCGFYFPRRVINTQQKLDRYESLDGFYHFDKGDYFFYTGSAKKDDQSFFLTAIVSGLQEDEIQYSYELVREVKTEIEPLVAGVNAIERSIEADGRAILSGLFFDFDKTSLTEASQEALETIASYLNSHDGKRYQVVGHTDSMGAEAYNQDLSEGRARSVVDVLVKEFGVEAERLQARGMGFRQPVGNNATPQGRAENRRVELVLLSSIDEAPVAEEAPVEEVEAAMESSEGEEQASVEAESAAAEGV